MAAVAPQVPDVAIVALAPDALAPDDEPPADGPPADGPLDALPPDAATEPPPPMRGTLPNWLVPERRTMRNRMLVWLAWLLTAMVVVAAVFASSIAFLGGERVAGYATEAGAWLATIVERLTRLLAM
ncbi:MAG: hypothetical protein K2Y05_07045 [Hyphomicrobiaceae bacterium]|nr:hypothetical protein [Hyphomicrobiaceae bacterium]